MLHLAVHGNWGSWTEISGCSHSCGGGSRYRLRMCNKPSPSFGGNWCAGNVTEFQTCNAQACPGNIKFHLSYLHNLEAKSVESTLLAVQNIP